MAASKHPSDNTVVLSSSPMVTVSPQTNMASRPPTTGANNGAGLGEGKVLDKRRLQELVKEVDPLEQLDDDVEEVCMWFEIPCHGSRFYLLSIGMGKELS